LWRSPDEQHFYVDEAQAQAQAIRSVSRFASGIYKDIDLNGAVDF
jgi:hypothetical protein